MAISFGSISTTTYSSATNLVISKPSGLAVGDIMIAQLNGAAQFTVPTGWSSLGFQFADSALQDVFAKIADSNDVSATNFTFSDGAGTNTRAGSIYRIVGGKQDIGEIQTIGTTRANSSVTPFVIATGLTPALANSLIMILGVTSEASSSPAHSGYTLATNDPVWTERVDITTGGRGMYGATAIRAEKTATGTASISITNLQASSDCVGRLIVIRPAPVSFPITLESGSFFVTGILVRLGLDDAGTLKKYFLHGKDTIEGVDQLQHEGEIFSVVSYLPGLSNINMIQLVMKPGGSGGSTVVATVRVYLNQTSQEFLVFPITKDDVRRGWKHLPIGRTNVHAIQLGWTYSDTTKVSNDNFAPSLAEIYYDLSTKKK